MYARFPLRLLDAEFTLLSLGNLGDFRSLGGFRSLQGIALVLLPPIGNAAVGKSQSMHAADLGNSAHLPDCLRSPLLRRYKPCLSVLLGGGGRGGVKKPDSHVES
jgi:hypothetical protein